jgi:hypothetical protein
MLRQPQPTRTLAQGALDVGVDIPSGEDVTRMQALIDHGGDTHSLAELWQAEKAVRLDESARIASPAGLARPDRRVSFAMVRQASSGGASPKDGVSGNHGGAPALYAAPDGFQGTYEAVAAYVAALEQAHGAAVQARVALGRAAVYQHAATGFEGTYAELQAHLRALKPPPQEAVSESHREDREPEFVPRGTVEPNAEAAATINADGDEGVEMVAATGLVHADAGKVQARRRASESRQSV